MEGFERKRKKLVVQDAYRNSLSYLFSRICRFLPDYIFAHITTLIVRVFVLHEISFHQYLLNAFWEVSFLQNIGLTSSGQLLIPASWYLSAMLIVSYVIYLLLQKKYELYLYIIAPFSAMFSFCYFNERFGNLGVASATIGFTSTGITLGFATMSLGCIAYKAVEAFQKKTIYRNKYVGLMQTLFEIGLLSLTGYVCYRPGRDAKDFVIAIFCMMLIASAATGKSLIAAICNYGTIRAILIRAGKLSYIIFLNHTIFLSVLKNDFALSGEAYLKNAIIFLGVTVIYSFFADTFVRAGMKAIKKLMPSHNDTQYEFTAMNTH